MIEGLTFIENSYNIGVDVLLTIIGFAISLIFGVKGTENFIFTLLIIMGLLSSGFYVWSNLGLGSFDWTLPFKLFILGVIMLSLNLYKRQQTGVI